MSCNDINSWWSGDVTLRTLYLLFIGQLASCTLAVTSFTSSFIANLGVDAPVTQSAFSYFTLALVYGGILLYRRQRLRVSWYWYLLLGFVDLQANFLANKAYQFTSITSVTLLDGCTLAWAIILTWLFLDTRYSLLQLFGAAICMLGLGLLLLSDAGVVGGGGGGSRPILGDILVIIGTMFYAMSNVGEEYFVKKKDRVEVVCMIGVYGLLNSSSSSTMLWIMTQVDWLYFLAFAIVVFGLIIYSTNEKDPIPIPALEKQNNDVQYQLLDNEYVASRNDASNS